MEGAAQLRVGLGRQQAMGHNRSVLKPHPTCKVFAVVTLRTMHGLSAKHINPGTTAHTVGCLPFFLLPLVTHSRFMPTLTRPNRASVGLSHIFNQHQPTTSRQPIITTLVSTKTFGNAILNKDTDLSFQLSLPPFPRGWIRRRPSRSELFELQPGWPTCP